MVLTEPQIDRIMQMIYMGHVQISDRARVLQEYAGLYLSQMQNQEIKRALLPSAAKLIEIFHAERILNER